MRVTGMSHPGFFSVESIPGTNRSLIRLFQNVVPCQLDGLDAFEYNEYHVIVETWDGIHQNVADNYDVFLAQGIANDSQTSMNVFRSLIDSI